MNRLLAVLLVVGSVSVLAQSPRSRARTVKPAAEAPPAERTLLRPARLDFEGSKLTGQLNTAGGVYLYDRKQLSPRSMIHKPESFRAEITEPL